ncbi:MAG: AAA family ATPase, partial [Actinobacteria bacterium]|nr:AAA family ATPase [Actinomycetota bacterium]
GLPPSAPDFEPDAPEAETAPAPPAFEPVATGQLPPVPAGIPPLDAREERAPEQAAGPSLGAGVPRPRVRPGAGKVLTVMAGKGGSGKTITATNLAMALTEAAGPGRVVIVDADLQFGDVALLLQVDPVRTIVDAAARLDDLGGDEMDALLLHHPSGLRVLPAPLLPAAGEEIGAKHVVRVVEILRDMFPYVVVDTGPVFDDGLITLLEHSDHVLLVVDMDLPSVKNAKIALDTLRASRFEMGRIHLTVNRANSKARLDLTELERALGEQVDGAIPSDRLIPQSVNEGVPAVAFSPRSRVAKAFHELAEAFLDR